MFSLVKELNAQKADLLSMSEIVESKFWVDLDTLDCIFAPVAGIRPLVFQHQAELLIFTH